MKSLTQLITTTINNILVFAIDFIFVDIVCLNTNSIDLKSKYSYL